MSKRSVRPLLIAVCVMLAVLVVRDGGVVSASAPTNSWSALGSGINGQVSAIAFDSNGNLFAGGSFSQAGGMIIGDIARWDGSNWHDVGGSIPQPGNRGVQAIAIDANDNLYIGGGFTEVGGVAVSNIAKWDGSNWTALAAGLDGRVSAIAIAPDGDVYATGEFFNSGTTALSRRIAKWNGTVWNSIGTGSGMNDSSNSLAFDSAGLLYAGGNFTSIDGVSVGKVALWDGLAWNSLAVGSIATVFAVAVDNNDDLYAGGGFTSIGGVNASRIAKWNGMDWNALDTGIGFGTVQSIAVDSSNNIYISGFFQTAGGVTVNNIAKWNGTSWSALSSGVNGEARVLTFDTDGNLFVGGTFTSASRVDTGGIAKWNSGSSPTTVQMQEIVATPNATNILWVAILVSVTLAATTYRLRRE